MRNPHPNHVPASSDGQPSTGGRTEAGSREALSKSAVEDMLQTQKSATRSKVLDLWEADPALSAVIPKPSERSDAQDGNTAASQPTDTPTATTTEVQRDEDAVAVEYERPEMDIFKAIFENSDDEDEDEPEETKATEGPTIVGPPVPASTGQPDEEEDDFVGPPLPPAPPSAATTAAAAEPAEELKKPASEEPFRPKFTRPTPQRSSEQIVVQPFKPRFSKRRHVVSFSEDEDEKQGKAHSHDEHEEERRSAKKKKKSSSSSSSKHKKKDKKEKSSRRRHRKHDDSDDAKHEDEDPWANAEWVEKEPQVQFSSSTPSSSSQPPSRARIRARAADLWK